MADVRDLTPPNRRHRPALISIAAIFAALIVLGTWAIASPPGSSPDDVYHLASIWCAEGSQPGTCELLPDGDAKTPQLIAQGNCHANNSGQSGACITGDEKGFVTHPVGRYQPPGWGQFYPPIFYRTMHAFVTPDATGSIVAMRLFNALLAVIAACFVLALAPAARRGPLALAWLVAVVPMGLFILTATNPQSWGLIGAATAWCLALIWREQPTGRRRAVAGVGCLLMLAIAFSGRFDAGVFATIGAALGLLLSRPFLRWARARLRWIVLSLATVVALVAFQAMRSSQGAFVRQAVNSIRISDNDQFYRNLVDLPQYWFGNLGSYGGEWGLGQLDTVLPAAVGVLGLIAFGSTILLGLGRSWPLKSIAVVGLVVALVAIPVVVLQARLIEGATEVGVGVQPRYFLPLMMILVGIALVSRQPYESVRFSTAQRWFLWACISASQAVALHTLLRRYTSGQDILLFSLNQYREWWWQHLPNPDAVWLVASLGFAFVVYVVLARFRQPQSTLTRE
jgi:hypothetical protein